MVPLEHGLRALSSGHTAYIGRWYRPVAGGGTVSIPKFGDVTLFCSNFEVIGAYKYPTLFWMKGHESVYIILNSWGVKVL